MQDLGLILGAHCFTGALYFTDLCVNFCVGFVVRYNFKSKLIKNPASVARYYVVHGTFRYDVVSTFAWIAQVRGRSPVNTGSVL